MDATHHILDAAAHLADRCRSFLLRRTMRFAWGRRLLKRRHERIAFFFVVVALLSLMLSLYAPVLVLGVGPAIYGVPHLLASLRYVQRGLAPGEEASEVFSKGLFLQIFGAAFIAVAIFRLMPMPSTSARAAPFMVVLPEVSLALLASLALAHLNRRQDVAKLRGVVVPALLVPAAWWAPFETLAVLTLLHNFVAFAYWFFAAKTRADRVVAAGATGFFTLISFALAGGYFDQWAYSLALPWLDFSSSGLSYEEFGRLVAPWTQDGLVWWHLVVAYAFGQTMHYFVWLKAIPEQHLRQPVAVPFQESLAALRRDWGNRQSEVAVVLCVAGALIFLVCKMPLARLLYFAAASFHGFFEIAGLGFLRSQLPRQKTAAD